MDELRGNAAAVLPTVDDFACVYQDYIAARDRVLKARTAVEEAGEQADTTALRDKLATALNDGDPAFQAMMRMPAPTMLALFNKLEAMSDNPFDPSPWEDDGHVARILADAATLSLQPAKAWIDRWRALGGYFGYTRKKGEEPRLMRGMLICLDLWKPTDRDNPDLPPHAWLIEPEHHAGAVKVLDGLLELTPGLQEAVKAVAAVETPLAPEGL